MLPFYTCFTVEDTNSDPDPNSSYLCTMTKCRACDLNPKYWHSDGIPERIFPKSWFWKKSRRQKFMIFSRMQRFNSHSLLIITNNLMIVTIEYFQTSLISTFRIKCQYYSFYHDWKLKENVLITQMSWEILSGTLLFHFEIKQCMSH